MLRTHDHLDERQFVIAVQRMADSLGYGADTSPYVGAGIDYAQSRIYTFGDSIKSIDWRVTARTGKAFVKEYEAHKRMPIYLLLDTSGSMMVGSTGRTKYEWAVMLAGALALAGLNRLNPVAMFACSEADITSDHHLRFHPSLSRQQVYQWLHHLRALPQMEPRATALATALRDVDISASERSVIVLLSDMHEPEATGTIKRMAQRHDVIVLRLQDPAERGRTGGGIFRAAEAETGERFVATGRSRYLEQETVTADLRRAGVSMITLPTEKEFLPELRVFLKTRASGRGGRDGIPSKNNGSFFADRGFIGRHGTVFHGGSSLADDRHGSGDNGGFARGTRSRADSAADEDHLHIAGTKTVAGGTEYDLRYTVMEPGKYDLRACLQDRDGRAVAAGSPVMVEGVSLLPAKHDANLLKVPPTPMRKFGGYTTLATVAMTVWALVLISLLLVGRKRRLRPLPVELPAAPLTLAERLRPLVAAAVRGELTILQKSELEMLLLRYWRRRLQLEELTMEEVMSRLRQDHGSGELVEALESWLHAPATAKRHVDIGRALAPYEQVFDEAVEEETAAV